MSDTAIEEAKKTCGNCVKLHFPKGLLGCPAGSETTHLVDHKEKFNPQGKCKLYQPICL